MTLSFPSKTLSAYNLVDGAWQNNGPTQEVLSPYFGRIVGHYSPASPETIEGAIEAAAESWSKWRQTPLKDRTQVMFRFRDQLLQHSETIANTISLENGKTLSEARAELMKGIEVLEFALSLQNLDCGGRMEVSRGVHCEYRRQSLGVVASITPFNFPAMVPMWTIPIALTLGNCYVWKPSEKTPLTSKLIADALIAAGLPAGVMTVLQGGQEVAEAIIRHPLVKAVGFVGSTPVARAVYQQATQLGKRALALGGAKNHIILLPDANPELSGGGISDSFTGCAGQRCMAASTLLAVGDVEPQLEQMIKKAQSLKLGKDMGAIITAEQRQFLDEAISRAVADGAKLVLDGRTAPVPSDFKDGFWLGPTILDQVKPGSEAATRELFGPVIAIIRCASISEAMTIENSNPYGNACSVFTGSGKLAENVIRQAKAGMVGVNIGVPVPREPFSFGGIQDSKFGHGDITGVHSLDFWSDMKKVTTKWMMQADHNWMS